MHTSHSYIYEFLATHTNEHTKCIRHALNAQNKLEHTLINCFIFITPVFSHNTYVHLWLTFSGILSRILCIQLSRGYNSMHLGSKNTLHANNYTCAQIG